MLPNFLVIGAMKCGKRWLLEELRPEVAGLRQWLGADFDGWGLLE